MTLDTADFFGGCGWLLLSRGGGCTPVEVDCHIYWYLRQSDIALSG
nr:MAG TPA: hypothetical protein [Bacteriophage sp.]